MRKGTYAYFKELPPKTIYSLHGDVMIKQSTLTAKYIEYPKIKSRYTEQFTLCLVAKYSRLGSGYFAANYHTNTSLPLPE